MRLGKSFWLLVILTAITVFVCLGRPPLLDPDEPVYGETPKEMILYHDYLSPRIYGQVWYDKPPMYYWLVAASYKTFGINEFAARFPSALLAVAGVVLVYLAGTKLFNQRAGIAGGLVLATSLEYFYLGKAAVTDITLTLFLSASLLCFLLRRYYLFYFFAALATLTKGPIGFLFQGAIILIWLALTRRFGELKQMKIPAGIAIFAIVAGPWYWLMYQIHGAAFINGFIGINNIVRFTTAEHARTSGWYFFIPVLILGFFPWTSVLVQAVRSSLTTKGTGEYSSLLFLNIWAAFIFFFFSISQTKLVTYILPVFPPLAMLVGWYLDRCERNYRLKGEGLVWPVVLTLLCMVLLGGIAVGIKVLPAIKAGAIGIGLVLILMTIATWYFLRRRKVLSAVWGQAAGMALVSVIIVTLLMPPVADSLSMRATSQRFTASYDGTSPVYVLKFLHPGFTFYTGVCGQEINSLEEIKRVIHKQERAYLVIKESQYQDLNKGEKGALTILAQAGNKLLLIKP
ncbi:dolichyl-phosphate-mannose-protein mannosyltransferase [Lucifera butyrica]|uniref:Dolichyl-phosphate-mannose-protein mannosyltransferase n=1 Tax=Lucifera butyrica TaxID=1351585 RepID=A0A498RBF7_9FIRM|nr:glycosyltransferase family 39 protein [Lucifera butyrica]VBB08280.1 dolichyl-phosphate-mannose-protein mannosyltransferase [Lucifera butyrica]